MVEKIKGERKPEWHLLEAFFTRENGLEPASVDGVPVLIPGKLGDVPVIQVPSCVMPDVLDRISKAVIDACGMEPFIITSNVQIVRFKRVSDAEAKAMMAKTREKLRKIEAERARIQNGGHAVDGHGSIPDGVGSGDAGADDAEGDPSSGGDDAAQPGEEPAQEG